jgi:hypothetical protein
VWIQIVFWENLHVISFVTNLSKHILNLILFEDFVTGISSDTVECIDRSQVLNHRSMSLIRRIISSPSGSSCSEAYLQGENNLSSYLSLVFHYSSHHIPFCIYPSVWSVLSTIVQKEGDCWCNICLPCVLEIVDRNRYGLIYLLVHTERKSPYITEGNAVSGAEFEEFHQSISALQRRTSYICWSHLVEKIDVKKSTPRKFTAEAKLLIRYSHPKKLTAMMEVEDKVKT